VRNGEQKNTGVRHPAKPKTNARAFLNPDVAHSQPQTTADVSKGVVAARALSDTANRPLSER